MARCEPVPDHVKEAIQRGIEWPLGPGFMVKSHDYQSAYFIAARVDLGHESRIGVWTTNRLDDTGSIFSVNDAALEHSQWGLGPRTKAEMSMDRDGASEAYGCAQRSA